MKKEIKNYAGVLEEWVEEQIELLDELESGYQAIQEENKKGLT